MLIILFILFIFFSVILVQKNDEQIVLTGYFGYTQLLTIERSRFKINSFGLNSGDMTLFFDDILELKEIIQNLLDI